MTFPVHAYGPVNLPYCLAVPRTAEPRYDWSLVCLVTSPLVIRHSLIHCSSCNVPNLATVMAVQRYGVSCRLVAAYRNCGCDVTTTNHNTVASGAVVAYLSE